ncbi:MAG: response regulator, partial [Phormidesmis sp.]
MGRTLSEITTATTTNAKPTGRILVVDDTPTNRVILSKLLLCEGYEVSLAEDGFAAIALALTWQPAVILLDIMMPGMDGYAACKSLRAKPETAAIPIIFLSALDAPFDKVHAFQHGAADYITKPFQAEEVLARVRHQINLQTAKQEQERLHAELESQVQAQDQQLRNANRQLIEESLTDSLTRLPNRAAFVEQLRKAID